MKLLDEQQIQKKIERLAIQILENNFGEKQIILVGINNNGMRFAEMLLENLENKTKTEFELTQLRLNPADPVDNEVSIDYPLKKLANKVIIIVDDVANTGRTLFYAFKPLMAILPKKVEVAVLVNREHKSFPIKVDYVGMSLATTMHEHIEVKIKGKRKSVALS